MLLTQTEFINGIFSLIYSIIHTCISILIASKYSKYKQKLLLYVGLSTLGVALPWFPSSISFLMVILIGIPLPDQLYIFIGNAFNPIALVLWIYAMCNLLNIKFKKITMLTYIIIGIVYEIFLIYFILNDTTVIAERYDPVDVGYKGFVLIFSLFSVISILLTGVWFSFVSFKSENKAIRLKGKFLLIGFLIWCSLAITESLFLNIILLIIVRILLITSAIFFYIGWILPRVIRKLFNCHEESSK